MNSNTEGFTDLAKLIKILAEYAMNVVDCGTAVMNMHAPFEVTSKVDAFETMQGYKAFLENT